MRLPRDRGLEMRSTLRALRAGVMACLLIGALAGPVEAKAFSLGRMVVRGPGLDGPLLLTGRQVGLPDGEDHPAAVALEGLLGRYPNSPSAPTGRLGPRYRLRYELDLVLRDGRVAVLVQDLYPYADGGPTTFTPPGQSVLFHSSAGRRDVQSGWQPFPLPLVDRLQRFGLPPAPVTDIEGVVEARSAEVPDTSRGAPRWMWLGLPVVAVVAGLALVAARFHQRIATDRYHP